MTDVEVRGKYLLVDGSSAVGVISFAPSVAAVNDSDGNTYIAAPVEATLDEDGEFTVTLQATDDASLDPVNWTYTVVETFDEVALRTYSIQVPEAAAGTGIDLWDVAPVPSAPGDYSAYVTLVQFASALATVDASLASLDTRLDVFEADTGWVDLVLINGWTTIGFAPYTGIVPAFRRIGDIVYARGFADGTAKTNDVMGMIQDPMFYPATVRTCPQNGGFGHGELAADGNLYGFGSYLAVAGLPPFPAAT